MQVMSNIEVHDGYEVQRIVTACPHCFNTIKNEYAALGGNYEIMHHTKFLKTLLEEGRLKVEGGKFKGKRITFHDPCYLGRANGEYEAPRALLENLEVELIEMRRCKSKSLCCGAGGAQMFKEPKKENKYMNVEHTDKTEETNSEIIAT